MKDHLTKQGVEVDFNSVMGEKKETGVETVVNFLREAAPTFVLLSIYVVYWGVVAFVEMEKAIVKEL